jgi:hypothetical protein
MHTIKNNAPIKTAFVLTLVWTGTIEKKKNIEKSKNIKNYQIN